MAELMPFETLTLLTAQQLVDAALRKAANLGVGVCIAVVDSSGDLKAFARMDDAPILSTTIAQDKAYSVIAFRGMPTHDWWPLLEGDPALLHSIMKIDRIVIVAGGIPVVVRGDVVGAVGVSGATAEEDRAIAEQAVASLVAPPSQ